MVLAWSQDRVGPLTRTAEDAAMVFNVIHGAAENDNSTITMPFHFNPNIDFASLRIGLRRQQNADANFTAFIDKLKSMGAKPREIPDPPQVAGSRGGLSEESAAAFDSYVEMKAKQLGITMDSVLTAYGSNARGGGRGGPPARGRGAEGTGRGPESGQLNRWVPGRVPTAMEFLQSQRRRQMLITAWQEYLKDIDLYLGAADTGTHAQTGHPVAVGQRAFAIRQPNAGRGGRGGRGGDSAAAAPAAPPVALNPQPICTQVAGNLYNDDIILSFAHKFQVNTDFHTHRPKLG
jgi:Asp-tRNA(Asn)/Glu-tRNA(Gln) amidotransferase A subunit family amidase